MLLLCVYWKANNQTKLLLKRRLKLLPIALWEIVFFYVIMLNTIIAIATKNLIQQTQAIAWRNNTYIVRQPQASPGDEVSYELTRNFYLHQERISRDPFLVLYFFY